MATIIGKTVGAVAHVVSGLEQGRIFTSPLNKIWRAKILINRASSPMPKAQSRGLNALNIANSNNGKVNDLLNQHYAREDSYSTAQRNSPWVLGRKQVLSGTDKDSVVTSNDLTSSNREMLANRVNALRTIDNQIWIINKYTNPPTILTIQNRPNELQITPQSYWVAVKSMGRNNPFMMYTGGEDTISFDISWYASDPNNRKEVITKCNLLKSWTKADGYLSSPPVLNILWGTSGLFDNDEFILESAPFILTHFQNGAIFERPKNFDDGIRDPWWYSKSAENLHLYPNCATQTLTFKRVSATNQRRVEIVSLEDLAVTRGIESPQPLETLSI